MIKKLASLAFCLMSSNLVAMKGQLQTKPIMDMQEQIILPYYQRNNNLTHRKLTTCLKSDDARIVMSENDLGPRSPSHDCFLDTCCGAILLTTFVHNYSDPVHATYYERQRRTDNTILQRSSLPCNATLDATKYCRRVLFISYWFPNWIFNFWHPEWIMNYPDDPLQD